MEVNLKPQEWELDALTLKGYRISNEIVMSTTIPCNIKRST